MTRKFNLIDSQRPELQPKRATPMSAGYDFRASEDVTIPNDFKPVLVPTGITVEMEANEYMTLASRSSNATKRHLLEPNGIGIIDADYTGEILVPLINFGVSDYTIKAGDRIAQGIFNKYLTIDNDEPLEANREGGFGSTGEA